MQLGHAEALGVLDHHDGGIGYIDPDFNDGGGDQHIDLAALEAAHDDLFFVGVEPAVEQADVQPGQFALAQLGMHFDGRLEAGLHGRARGLDGFGEKFCRLSVACGSGFGCGRGRWFKTPRSVIVREVELRLIVFAPLNHRINDVGLAALLDLLADELPDLFGIVAGHPAGGDGRAAGRQFVEDAEVKVAIERQSQGARNWGCGHHQHVGFCPLRAVRPGFLDQPEALHDAEAVLLVDHDQAEAIELDFFLDQRVGADDQLRFAAIDQPAGKPLAVRVERAGQQHDTGFAAGALEQFSGGQEVLGGEDLGGRHEGGLVTVFHGDQHGLQRDDGFARADVALQQAAHRARSAHVGDDLAQSTLLRGRRMKGQHLAKRFAHLVGGGEGDAGALAQAAALELQAELEEEQLLEDEAAVSRGRVGLELGEGGAFRRVVNLAQSSFAIGKIESVEQGCGQVLGHGAADRFEQMKDDSALPA